MPFFNTLDEAFRVMCIIEKKAKLTIKGGFHGHTQKDPSYFGATGVNRAILR